MVRCIPNLQGRQFSLVTDHKLLISAIGARVNDATVMQSRYWAYISKFSTDMQNISGPDNFALQIACLES